MVLRRAERDRCKRRERIPFAPVAPQAEAKDFEAPCCVVPQRSNGGEPRFMISAFAWVPLFKAVKDVKHVLGVQVWFGVVADRSAEKCDMNAYEQERDKNIEANHKRMQEVLGTITGVAKKKHKQPRQKENRPQQPQQQQQKRRSGRSVGAAQVKPAPKLGKGHGVSINEFKAPCVTPQAELTWEAAFAQHPATNKLAQLSTIVAECLTTSGFDPACHEVEDVVSFLVDPANLGGQGLNPGQLSVFKTVLKALNEGGCCMHACMHACMHGKGHARVGSACS